MAKTRVGSHPSYGGTVVVNATSSFTKKQTDSYHKQRFLGCSSGLTFEMGYFAALVAAPECFDRGMADIRQSTPGTRWPSQRMHGRD